MPHPLDSAFSKLAWAESHMQALNQEVASFIHDDMYTTRADVNSQHVVVSADGRPLIAAEDVTVFGFSRASPLVRRWALMIGDIANSFRNALDHLIWALSLDFHRGDLPVDPIPSNSDWTRVQFPIRGDIAGWNSAQAALKFICPDFRPIIKSLQPFQLGDDYKTHGLWLLQELSNRDKHRAVPVAAMSTGIGLPEPTEQVVFSFLDGGHFGPFEYGAELAKVRVTFKEPLPPDRLPEDANFKLMIDVVLQDRESVWPNIREALWRVSVPVGDTLRFFKPDGFWTYGQTDSPPNAATDWRTLLNQ